jgi:membrane-bound acyltransferase YfiQ involved in biofilm formation
VNKKLNTVLFMLGATVFNLLLLFVLILLAMLALTAAFGDRLGPSLMSILLIVVFLGAMVGSFLIYNQLVKWLARRIDMEKYFLPLFKRRPPRKDGAP